MRNQLMIWVSAFLYYSGLMRIVHWLHQRSGQRLLILNYHHASDSDLRRHLLYLRKHFRLSSLDSALDELFTTDKKQVPRQDRLLPLALTFDDGYEDNYTHAYALAQELHIPISIFLISGYIDNSTISNQELGPLLTWNQVHEMQASGLVAFGGHTLHHPILSSLINKDEVCQEIAGCRSLLEQKLGQAPRIFAYPHGGIEHIGVNGILAVRRSGYQWAMTTIPGSNTPDSHPLLLQRFSADTHMHWLVIALITSGIWDILSALHWFGRRYRNPTRSQLKRMFDNSP